MRADEMRKRDFIIRFYSELAVSQGMIFVNKKVTASFL